MAIFKRVDLCDEVEPLPADSAGSIASRLDVFGLSAEFRTVTNVVRVLFRGGASSAEISFTRYSRRCSGKSAIMQAA